MSAVERLPGSQGPLSLYFVSYKADSVKPQGCSTCSCCRLQSRALWKSIQLHHHKIDLFCSDLCKKLHMLQPGIVLISSLGFEIFWPGVRTTKINKCYDRWPEYCQPASAGSVIELSNCGVQTANTALVSLPKSWLSLGERANVWVLGGICASV